MTPAGLALLLRAFPPAERARVAGILVVPSSFAPVPGPVLGGLFVTSLSWRWAFYVNVPVGIAAVVFGLLFLDEQERQEAGAFDARGFVLGCLGLASLMYGLSEGPGQGWRSPGVIVASAAGVLLLAGLVRVELSRRAGPEHAPRSPRGGDRCTADNQAAVPRLSGRGASSRAGWRPWLRAWPPCHWPAHARASGWCGCWCAHHRDRVRGHHRRHRRPSVGLSGQIARGLPDRRRPCPAGIRQERPAGLGRL